MDISRHDSPNYGRHLTQEQVHDLFAPSDDNVAAVNKWLREAGIKNFIQSVNKQWMQLDLTAEELGSLLKTQYYEWEHVNSGTVHVACDEYAERSVDYITGTKLNYRYHVPKHIAPYIDYITPGIKLYAGRGIERDIRPINLGSAATDFLFLCLPSLLTL